MKVIFIAGSYSSGTSAVTGILDQMGVASLPPHFRTKDPLTPNSYESVAFRNLVNAYADGMKLTTDPTKAAKFVQDLRELVKNADGGPADALVLKMPLASICLPQIIEAVDPHVILVHRPLEEIEASRMRRNWAPIYGALGARLIYSKLVSDLVQMRKSYLAVSYRDLQENPRREMQRMLDFCDLSALAGRIDDAVGFVRGPDAKTAPSAAHPGK